MSSASSADPHTGTRTLAHGAPLEDARAAMIMLHGRGASPQDILGVAPLIDPGGVIYLAPAAMGGVWYPQMFMMPQSANQPWLDSALRRIDSLISQVETAGLPAGRVVLLGFSQGACLALEYAARNARRYGGVAALSGGLIGAEEDLQGYGGSLEGTPVFLGCSNIDPYIPESRVRRSAEIIEQIGGQVEVRIYPAMGHNINQDEIDAVSAMLKEATEEKS